MVPELEFVYELNAELSAAIDVGATPAGFRRVIQITSGEFSGPRMHGTLLSGGADWQIIRADRVTELHAHYVLVTEDDTRIQVNVRGLRHAPDAGADAMHYFRIAPVFEAPEGAYEWMNRSVFIGSGERMERSVRIRVFRVL